MKKMLAMAAIGSAGLLYLLEKRIPRRRETVSKPLRNARNLALSSGAIAAMALVEQPAAMAAAAIVERKNIGLLKLIKLPRPVETALAVLLLDYTTYFWHILTHKIPFLWRFHRVHHADRDLDASTAFRFHFGENLISVVFRAGQIFVIGVSPEALRIWQTMFFASVVFHHSNLRLPGDLDERLAKLIVTPRLHGVHHSEIQDEADSNFSSGLTIWDRIHGTYRDEDETRELTIGVPGFPDDLSLLTLVALPLAETDGDWESPRSIVE
jgi:sterol desaturase/sphingolipid hydroxylase (fatty acid hydroxylase superfamily)